MQYKETIEETVFQMKQDVAVMKTELKIIVEQLRSVKGALSIMIERLEDNDGNLDH